MNRKLWSGIVTLLAVSIFASATAASAVEPTQAGSRSREGRLQRELGLTDQQVQAIRQIRERDAEAWKQLWQSLRQAQADLRRLVLADADQASMQAKHAEVRTLMAETLERRVNTLKEIAPLLTPEQREKYAELLDRAWRPRQYQRPSS